MTLFFLCAIAVIIAGAALVIYQQKKGSLAGSKNNRALPPKERTVFDLQIGDIVQHMGIDWVVEGRLTYSVGSYSWFEYLLQDGDRIAWLSVDEDDRVEVALLEQTNQLDVSETPPQQLTFAGETYRCVDSGVAKMTRIGTTMRRKAEKCNYFDYEGSGDRVLSIEVWDGDVEVTVGEKINPRSLMLLPGDGRGVYR